MKFVNRMIALAMIVLTISACSAIDDNLNNPTEVTPEGAQIDDLLLCNASGEIIEATSANFFYMKRNKWYTPFVNSEGVAGVMRDYVIDLLDATDHSVSKKNLDYQGLPQLQSAFLTNALMQVSPVKAITDGHHFYQLNLSYSKQVQLFVEETIRDIG